MIKKQKTTAANGVAEGVVEDAAENACPIRSLLVLAPKARLPSVLRPNLPKRPVRNEVPKEAPKEPHARSVPSMVLLPDISRCCSPANPSRNIAGSDKRSPLGTRSHSIPRLHRVSRLF